jgi:hypothetical protein
MGEDEKYLKDRGWHTWYNPNYWVHKDLVEDPNSMDYTNYGMSLDHALDFEKKGKPKFRSMGFPPLSMLEMAARMEAEKRGLVQ